MIYILRSQSSWILGCSIGRTAGDPERRDVRPQRVRHARDGARPRVVRRHCADGVRRQRRNLLRHRAHAHSWPRPKHAQVSFLKFQVGSFLSLQCFILSSQ